MVGSILLGVHPPYPGWPRSVPWGGQLECLTDANTELIPFRSPAFAFLFLCFCLATVALFGHPLPTLPGLCDLNWVPMRYPPSLLLFGIFFSRHSPSKNIQAPNNYSRRPRFICGRAVHSLSRPCVPQPRFDSRRAYALRGVSPY